MQQETFDVVVVGGGAIGLACAWRASRRGLRVVVLDRGDAGAATSVSAGMLAPATEAEFGADDLLRLNLASAERWPSFAVELGDDIGYERSGTLYVALDRDELEELERLAELQRSLGLETQRLTGRECRRLEPALAPACAGGLHAVDEAQVDPRRLVRALARNVEVRRADAMEAGPTHVVTADGAVYEGTVVVAAGAWAARIADVSVRPVKGQILRLRAPDELPTRRMVRTRDVYLLPRTSGEVVVGATVEERGFETAVTAGAVHELLREAYRAVPEIAELELAEAAAGLRPATPSNAPLLGRPDGDSPILACGHYRNGILLAPITADAIVALLTGEAPPVEVAPFAPREAVAR